MNPRDLDNWITGHYGEDYFNGEDDSEMKDDKQEIVVTMQISLPKQDAMTLAEFLQDLLDMMHVEGIVSFTNENNSDDDYTYGVRIHEP